MTRSYPAVGSQPFQPLPAPSGQPPFRLRLADVLPPSGIREIERAGHLRFHTVGDTGGLENPVPQQLVSTAMAAELRDEDPARFFYHLGDVIYVHGEEANYDPQFLEPYCEYLAPIFAIPGNHDGDPAPGTSAGSLDAFVKQFCAPVPASTPATPGGRRAATGQPNVYWTLLHDWITIVGLYTNVPDGGRIGNEQLSWLTHELRAAPPGVTLLLALHHPVYSADSVHGSNLALGASLDRCFAQAELAPDAILSAHAHSYQRFDRNYEGRQIPYVVAGTGGHPELHQIGSGVPKPPATFNRLPGLTLNAYQDTHFGFMTLTAGPGSAQAVYSVVAPGGTRTFDTFSIGREGTRAVD